MVGDWGHTGINDLFNEIVSGLVLHLSNNVWHNGVYGSGEGVSLLSSLSLLLINIATWAWDPGLGWLKAPLGTDLGGWDVHGVNLSEVSVLVDGVDSKALFLNSLSLDGLSESSPWLSVGFSSWTSDPSFG